MHKHAKQQVKYSDKRNLKTMMAVHHKQSRKPIQAIRKQGKNTARRRQAYFHDAEKA